MLKVVVVRADQMIGMSCSTEQDLKWTLSSCVEW
jgi:hypothetical protein